MSSFGEILGRFKKNEKPECIIPLCNDSKLKDALVAWMSVKIEYVDMQDCDLKDEQAQWHWMWSRVKYDQNQFGIVAGLKRHEISDFVTRLIGLKLVYPDGTINALASSFLQAEIMAKIGKAKKTPPKAN